MLGWIKLLNHAAIAIGSNLNAFFSSFTGLSNILPISFMAFTKTTNWFNPSPLATTTFLYPSTPLSRQQLQHIGAGHIALHQGVAKRV